MKNFHKALSILAAAALFAGCSSYDETNDPARAGNTSVKLLADVADDAETRAGISVGESTFSPPPAQLPNFGRSPPTTTTTSHSKESCRRRAVRGNTWLSIPMRP